MKVTGRFQQLRGFEEAVVRRYNESKGLEANVVEGDKFLEWCARAIIDNALFEQFLNGLVDFEAFRPDGKPVRRAMCSRDLDPHAKCQATIQQVTPSLNGGSPGWIPGRQGPSRQAGAH